MLLAILLVLMGLTVLWLAAWFAVAIVTTIRKEYRMKDIKVGDKIRLTGRLWDMRDVGGPEYGDIVTVAEVRPAGAIIHFKGQRWSVIFGNENWDGEVVE